MGLYDRAMVKDNHLMTDGNTGHLQECINSLRKEKPGVEIQLEADTLEQVATFLKLEGVDHILLDNMTPEMLKQHSSAFSSRYFFSSSKELVRLYCIVLLDASACTISPNTPF